MLSLIGFGAFVLASFAVGVRLLLLARRTREAPELAIGLALLLGGGFGYSLLMLALGTKALGGAAVPVAVFAGSTCTALGAISLAAGIQRIFQRGDPGSRAFVVAVALALGATLVGRALEPQRAPAAPWVFWVSTLASLAVYAWSAGESFHYYGQMRRRVRIGLADAITARRFLMWGVSAGAAVGMHVASMLSRAIVGSGSTHPALMATTSSLGLVAAIALWLAFFPRRSRAQAAATAR